MKWSHSGSGGVIAALAGALACSMCVVHLADSSGSSAATADAFASALTFGAPATRREGAMPAGSSSGPRVDDTPGRESTMVSPGSSTTISVPYSGGAIRAVNIGFGGSSYFQVAVGNTAESGTVNVPVTIGNFCGDLANICHMIQCYEQVVTPDGTVSRAQARQMVLNCTGGRDCNGDLVGQCFGYQSVPCPSGRSLMIEACVGAGSSPQSWYQVNGRRFGPCAAADQACLQASARDAVNHGTSLCTR